MTRLLSDTATVHLYFRTMIYIVPLLCSLVSTVLVLYLICKRPNSIEVKLRMIAAFHFFVTSAFWFVLLLCAFVEETPPALGTAMRIVFSLFAFGVPAILFSMRYYVKIASQRDDRRRRSDRLWRLRWIEVCIAVEAVMFALGVIFGVEQDFADIWVAVAAAVTSVQQILGTYYVMRRKYMRYYGPFFCVMNRGALHGEEMDDDLFERIARPGGPGTLTRRSLENYFHLKKPYLDPDFKLTDLAAALDVNRTEMSGFINRTYDVGFKRYVNGWRLAEYNRLMSLPSNERKNPHRIMPMAGFSDSRHYQRALEQENERSGGGFEGRGTQTDKRRL